MRLKRRLYLRVRPTSVSQYLTHPNSHHLTELSWDICQTMLCCDWCVFLDKIWKNFSLFEYLLLLVLPPTANTTSFSYHLFIILILIKDTSTAHYCLLLRLPPITPADQPPSQYVQPHLLMINTQITPRQKKSKWGLFWRTLDNVLNTSYVLTFNALLFLRCKSISRNECISTVWTNKEFIKRKLKVTTRART